MNQELLQGSDWTLEEVRVDRNDAVLAAAEGGDRVLRLLCREPKRVSVIDSSRAQLCLIELKLAGAKALSYCDYLDLMGNRPSRRRRELFQRIRWLLPKEADEFWLGRLGLIDRGVALQGGFERQLLSFRQFVRLVHGARKVERFQALATEGERREMYAREWQTFLWRRFGGKLWKRWFSIGPDRLERLLLEGRLLAPAPHLSRCEFECAKELANRILVVTEPPGEYLRTLPPASVDVLHLGRMDLRPFERELLRIARPEARLYYISELPEGRAPAGFVPQGSPREAGFFPGHLQTAMLPG